MAKKTVKRRTAKSLSEAAKKAWDTRRKNAKKTGKK